LDTIGSFSRKGSLAKLHFVSIDCGQCGHQNGKSAEDLSRAATCATSAGEVLPAGCGGHAGARAALGARQWQRLREQVAGCRQGAQAGRQAGRASLPAAPPCTWSQLDFDVATMSVWQMQYFSKPK